MTMLLLEGAIEEWKKQQMEKLKMGGCEERFAIDCCGAAGAGILARQLATTCLACSSGTVDQMVGDLVSLGLLLWVIYYIGLVVVISRQSSREY